MNSVTGCTNLLMQKCLLNKKFMDVYISVGRPRPFDVTLRDGLQTLSKEEQQLFSTDKKIKIYNDLIIQHSPKNIEIGSCVNEKIFPIFNDTESLFEYANKIKCYEIINNYVLVPNLNYLQNALKIGVKNFSLITSVSNEFQMKNTRMSISQNEEHIANMLAYLYDYSNYKLDNDNVFDYKQYNVKLYVSCINECPVLDKKLDNMYIVNTLERLSKFNIINKICLSDTCGTLTPEDFINILRICKKHGIDISKFSLHLHVKPEREHIAEELVFIALDNGINEFDVSELSSGGCSITMDSNKIAPNMNYEQYYRFLTNYLETRC